MISGVVNTLEGAQEVLEQNEDTIAATVENIQLLRLDQAITLYGSLQKNLISLGTLTSFSCHSNIILTSFLCHSSHHSHQYY